MAQNITIANATYSAVPAIDVPKQGGGTARYVDTAETAFVITISWDAEDEMWMPDCTFAQAQTAYGEGRQIVIEVNADEAIEDTQVSWCYYDTDSHFFLYVVTMATLSGDKHITYYWDANGLTVDDEWEFYDAPTGNINITQAGVTDVTNYATAAVPEMDFWEGYIQRDNYETINGQRYWKPTIGINAFTSGWIDAGTYGEVDTFSAVAANISVTPTESAQTIGGANYMMEGAVTVNAIPSNYVGSGIAQRDSSNLSASGATVTAPSGYYASNATKTISSGSATPAASISGTSATVTTGTNTLTLSKTVSNTPQVSAGYVSSGTAGNSSVSLTANVTTKAAATITPGTTNQTIASGTYLTGAQTISGDANLVAGNIKNGTTIFGVTGTYEGGGGSGMQVATKTTTLGAAAASISFSGLSGEPTSFAITTAADLATGASPWKTAAVTFDGTSLNGQIVTNTSNAQASHSTSFTKSYSNGTLTVTGTGTNFQANQYKLVYTYGGTSANLGTDDVQVGSGATSISFTGLSAEPDYFSIVFTSDFSTSSGYQRVMAVVYDGNSTYGVAMDSGAKALSSWSYTYNNGTLTVSSTGTNNGGYFHQPGDYHLTYGIGGTVEPVEIDVQPLSVTQNGTYTAPDGVAYSPVTVTVSGGGGANVDTTTWTNSSTSTVSHQFTDLEGTPKAAFLRCTSQLTRSSSNTYYYIADIVWDGTNARGNYHLRSNGSYNDVPSTGTAKYNVTVGTNSITFSSTATSRSSAPGSFYNGTYELTYVY